VVRIKHKSHKVFLKEVNVFEARDAPNLI